MPITRRFGMPNPPESEIGFCLKVDPLQKWLSLLAEQRWVMPDHRDGGRWTFRR
jgi:hypothetical protein